MELVQQNGNENLEAKDTLLMVGGIAMVVFGAGLIISNPIVRRFMSQAGVGGLNLLQLAVPDIERYMKIRNM